jgi:hypothetical protein
MERRQRVARKRQKAEPPGSFPNRCELAAPEGTNRNWGDMNAKDIF